MLWVIFFTVIASATELQKQNARLLRTNKILLQTLQKISSQTAVGAEDICEGKACGECLDDSDYACTFYDGKCILSESMKDPSAYKASKFVWMSEDCPAKCEDVSIMDGYMTCGGLNEMFNGNICKFDYGLPGGPCSCMCGNDDICEGKACGECLDDTDYACVFYDGKCISSDAMKDPSGFKMSKFVWTSDECPAERAVGNAQCAHINDDNKSYKCSSYYKKIVKCDICQDDNAGAVDNSAINDAISKRGMEVAVSKTAECSTASDCESPYVECWMGICVTEISVADELCTCTGRYSGWVAGGEACQFGNNCAPRSRCSNPNGKPCVFEA